MAFLQLAAKWIEAFRCRSEGKSISDKPLWRREEGKGARVVPCCAASEEDKLGERTIKQHARAGEGLNKVLCGDAANRRPRLGARFRRLLRVPRCSPL
ncbi:hypothetical protein SKAU_G00065350 [Synaphobranchus kaupii]|uniref:Uncharacterized protein n=1 Tax=Synaphobranchus kaupii TaxID=118154 RepID=A0A9Q1G5V4_SYNKA|nr:hypothetical protein SKAU_G00065350 [Synaphobranchus kaupii]